MSATNHCVYKGYKGHGARMLRKAVSMLLTKTLLGKKNKNKNKKREKKDLSPHLATAAAGKFADPDVAWSQLFFMR